MHNIETERTGEVMTEQTVEQRVDTLEDELREVRQVFRSGAGEIAALPDNAPPEKVLQVLKRFANRLLSVGRGPHK